MVIAPLPTSTNPALMSAAVSPSDIHSEPTGLAQVDPVGISQSDPNGGGTTEQACALFRGCRNGDHAPYLV
jgi:hypothetical protein